MENGKVEMKLDDFMDLLFEIIHRNDKQEMDILYSWIRWGDMDGREKVS